MASTVTHDRGGRRCRLLQTFCGFVDGVCEGTEEVAGLRKVGIVWEDARRRAEIWIFDLADS